MIYTPDKRKKYAGGERALKQIAAEVTDCQKYSLNTNSICTSNLCENHILLFITSGALKFKDRNICKGNIIYISKFSNYTFTALEYTTVMEIDFEYQNEITLFDISFRIMDASLEVEEYIDKIYSIKFFQNSLPGIREGLLINLLNLLNLSCDVSREELNILKNCRQWIEQNICYYITANDVATAFNYTPAHLNRIIKNHCEKGLSSLICEARVAKIKQLIRYTNYSTKKIADELGFDSDELLRKYFKYHTGMSIKSYNLNKKA